MKFNITFTGPPEPKESSDLLTEARAKIIWGEPAASVRYFLTCNGLSAFEADAKIKEFLAERNTTIKKIGLKNLLIGIALICISAVMTYFICQHPSTGNFTYRGAKGFGMILFAGLYGLWKLINGIIYLVRPQSEEESITEIE